MQQRRPRLGDILDDYCPRERRVTNHAVVAIVDDDVKQTRCTTCDAEHEYRQAKTPAPRRTKSSAALTEAADGAKPVLAVPRPLAEPERAAVEVPDVPDVPACPTWPTCQQSPHHCRRPHLPTARWRSTAHPPPNSKTSPSQRTRARTMARCIDD